MQIYINYTRRGHYQLLENVDFNNETRRLSGRPTQETMAVSQIELWPDLNGKLWFLIT